MVRPRAVLQMGCGVLRAGATPAAPAHPLEPRPSRGGTAGTGAARAPAVGPGRAGAAGGSLAAAASGGAAARHRVLAVATEWSSNHGGLSTFNRQLCCALASAGARVVCLVLRATAEERRDAAGKAVTLVEAMPSPGMSEELALARKPALPANFAPTIIIGHARLTGPAAKSLHEDHFPTARRLHFVHMAPDEIEWHKLDRADDAGVRAEERTETELLLGRTAHRVVAVGPRLHNRLLNDLFPFDAPAPLRLDPGFDGDGVQPDGRIPAGVWRILLFGRMEDAALKGLDLAARAVGLAVGRREMPAGEAEFVVRGAPAGATNELRRRLRDWAQLPSLEVVVRPYTSQAERLAADLRRASLVLMPSRKEGFGLVGVEAIVAGTPVLVSDASGLGALLREALPPDHAGRVVVSMSGDDHIIAERWARAVEAVLRDREAAFRRAAEIRLRLAEYKTWSAAVEALLTALDAPRVEAHVSDQMDGDVEVLPVVPRPASDARPSTTDSAVGGRVMLPVAALQRFAIALSEVPVMRDEESRQRVVEALRPAISRSVPRHAARLIDVYSIVVTCLDHEGGLAELLEIVRGFSSGSIAVSTIDDLLAETGVYEKRRFGQGGHGQVTRGK